MCLRCVPSPSMLTCTHNPVPSYGMTRCSGGGDLVVTDQNKQEFVSLRVNHVLVNSIAAQASAFSKGLRAASCYAQSPVGSWQEIIRVVPGGCRGGGRGGVI